MRILIVGMTESIHVARWVGQISDQGWVIHVFPSCAPAQVHPMLARLGVHVYTLDALQSLMNKIGNGPLRFPFTILRLLTKHIRRPVDAASRLHRAIHRFRPDIVHSIETQHAGYLVQETKEKYFKSAAFPKWLHTNWGSDLILFRALAGHKDRIASVLHECDYYSCEGQRDVNIAREMGFSKIVVGFFPNAGGFDINRIRSRNGKPPSLRRTILLKGYQGWSGRALVGIKALDLVGESLRGYSVIVYGNSRGVDVGIAAELLSAHARVPVSVLPHIEDYDRMLDLYAEARIYIGLGISDGISTSLLEAMAMGAFPIQSDTSMANEWIVDGRTGAIVPPEEPVVISRRIREALSDDQMVDSAAVANLEVITKKANADSLRRDTIEIYKGIYARR